MLNFEEEKRNIEFNQAIELFDQMIYEMQTHILPGENVTLWEKFEELDKRDHEINKEFLDSMPDFPNAKLKHCLEYMLIWSYKFYDEKEREARLEIFFDRIMFAFNKAFEAYNDYCDVNNHIQPTQDLKFLEYTDEYSLKDGLLNSIEDMISHFPDNSDEAKLAIMNAWQMVDTYVTHLRWCVADQL